LLAQKYQSYVSTFYNVVTT